MKKEKPPKPPVKDAISLTRKEARERVGIMAEFVEHRGWDIFENQMRQIEQFWKDKVYESMTPDDRAIIVGRLRMIREMLNWPVTHALQCQEAEIREQQEPGQGGFAPEPD